MGNDGVKQAKTEQLGADGYEQAQAGTSKYVCSLMTYDTGGSPEEQWKKCAEELSEVLFELRATKEWLTTSIDLPREIRAACLNYHKEDMANEIADCHMALANLARVCGLTPDDMDAAVDRVHAKLKRRGCYD